MVPEEFEKHQTELIEDLVHRFSQEMRRKLLEKMREGWLGFDQVVSMPMIIEKLVTHLYEPFSKENCADIANLFAMVWNLYDEFAEQMNDQNNRTP